jgi:hypothetical protein
LGIKNNSGNLQQATLLKNYGTVIGAISNQEFQLSPADSLTYFNTSTITTVANGLTIAGDISYTGKLLNKYLSTSVDIQSLYNSQGLTTQSYSPYDYQHVMLFQNPQIVILLTELFPPAGGNLETLTNEYGVPVGAEARVLCQTPANHNPEGVEDLQVRRFHVITDNSGPRWQPMVVYPITGRTSLTNIVPRAGTASTAMTNVPA